MDNLGIKKPKYHFGDRITKLMQRDGIDLNSKKPGPDRILLDKLISMGIIKLNTEKWDTEKETIKEYENRRKYDLTKVISKQREKASATEISTEWINNYCKVFNCDSDYLFGYTDTPSRDVTDISEATGLSEDNVRMLVAYKKIVDKRIKMEQVQGNPPRRKYYEDVEHDTTREIYEDPEYFPAVEKYEAECDQAVEEYNQAVSYFSTMYPHGPSHLISCIEILLKSCRENGEKSNIIDLIYSYLFNESWETIDISYSLERKGQVIESDYKGRIHPYEYDHTYLTINSDVYNRHKISELVEEAQLRSIYEKLSEIRKHYMRKEGE